MNLDFIRNNRVILLFIFALLSNKYFSQEKKDSTYKWGVGVAGTFNYAKFKSDDLESVNIKNHFIVENGINLSLTRSITKNISFGTGINYFKLSRKWTTFGIKESVWQMSCNFLSFPTELNFSFGKRKLNFLIKSGLEWSFFHDINNYYINTFKNSNMMNGMLGLQVNYRLVSKVTLFASLNFNKNLSPFVLTEDVKAAPDYVFKIDIDYFDLPIGLIYKF